MNPTEVTQDHIEQLRELKASCPVALANQIESERERVGDDLYIYFLAKQLTTMVAVLEKATGAPAVAVIEEVTGGAYAS